MATLQTLENKLGIKRHHFNDMMDFKQGDIVEVVMGYVTHDYQDERILEAEIVGKYNGHLWVVDFGEVMVESGYRCSVLNVNNFIDNRNNKNIKI